FGVCSGAWLALQSALRVREVALIMLVNLPVFVWRPEYVSRLDKWHGASRSYVAKFGKFSTWQRLVRGELDLATLGRAAWKAGDVIIAQVRNIFWQILADNNDTKRVRNWILELSRRGTQVFFATSDNDVARDELALHFGLGARWLRRMKGTRVASLGAS